MKATGCNVLSRFSKGLASTVLLSILVGCASSNYPFNPIVENKTYKKSSSIAVISGGEKELHMKLAGYITDGLAERSTFRVMSQREIAKQLPGYPPTIAINLDVKEGDEKPVWFPASEKAKLNAIQAKLKVDYIFVVWNRFARRVETRSSNGGSTYDYVYPAGNLIEYPSGKVVASTMSAAGSMLTPLALARDADYYILDALKGASGHIVDEFVDVTDSKK